MTICQKFFNLFHVREKHLHVFSPMHKKWNKITIFVQNVSWTKLHKNFTFYIWQIALQLWKLRICQQSMFIDGFHYMEHIIYYGFHIMEHISGIIWANFLKKKLRVRIVSVSKDFLKSYKSGLYLRPPFKQCNGNNRRTKAVDPDMEQRIGGMSVI